MKKAFFLFAAMAAAVFAITGCESESMAEHSVTISPSYANLALNQSATLTANGGWNYKWSLSNREAGSLSQSTGRTVVYTAKKEGVTQTVTVTGNGTTSESSGSSGTNATSRSTSVSTFSATATIVQ